MGEEEGEGEERKRMGDINWTWREEKWCIQGQGKGE